MELDLASLLRGVLANCAEEAARKGIHMTIAVADGVLVHADPATFEASLLQVVRDAIRRTRGGGSLLVSGRRLGGQVEVAVADDGPAADQELLAAHLRLVEQAIALQHGGRLEIETLRDGSIVRIRIPQPDLHPAPETRFDRRLVDKVLIAFHQACEQKDLEVAERLMSVLDFLAERDREAPWGRRRNVNYLVPARERLDHLRYQRRQEQIARYYGAKPDT